MPSYVVITSVGPRRFARRWRAATSSTASAWSERSPGTQIEVLVPDFRGRDEQGAAILEASPARRDEPQIPETAAPTKRHALGADYQFRLSLPFRASINNARRPPPPPPPTLSDEEILQVMRDMRAHGIEMLTIGQYLAPSISHLARAPLRPPRHVQTL